MKKYVFFPLWEIERFERMLNEMEKKGYRLSEVKYSYLCYFVKSAPRDVNYFLIYKTIVGEDMATWENALESKHSANPINAMMCYYSLYRTKVESERLSFLYFTRLDFIRKKLLEKALTALFYFVIFVIIIFLGMICSNENIWLIVLFLCIDICFLVYYLYGYFKQRYKCKQYGIL